MYLLKKMLLLLALYTYNTLTCTKNDYSRVYLLSMKKKKKITVKLSCKTRQIIKCVFNFIDQLANSTLVVS